LSLLALPPPSATSLVIHPHPSHPHPKKKITQVAAQRKAVWDIVKGLGSRLLRDGLNLTRTSLPVAVFEPRSFVQRVADNWAYLGLLDAAASHPDPVERLRLVTAFVVGGLSRQTSTLKPFNPILGETWAAEFVPTGGRGGGGGGGEAEADGAAALAAADEAAATASAPPPPPRPGAKKPKKPPPAWVRSLTVRRSKAGRGAAATAAAVASPTTNTTTTTAAALTQPPRAGWTHAGAAVWAEQISHHPPATAWLVESRVGREGMGGEEVVEAPAPAPALARAASGLCATLSARRAPPAASAPPPPPPPPSSSSSPPPNSWTFTGVGTWAAHFRGNSIAGRQAGGNAIFFAGDPARGSPPSAVSWELPPMAMRGIMFGARVLRYTGCIIICDDAHGLVAEIGIGGPPPGAVGEALGPEARALAKASSAGSGGGRGDAELRPDDLVGALLVRGTPVDTLVGSWLSHVDWLGRPPRSKKEAAGDGGGARPRRLWDARRDPAASPVPLAVAGGGGGVGGGRALRAAPAPPPPPPPPLGRLGSRAFSRAGGRAGTPPPAPPPPPHSSTHFAAAALPSDALAREDLVALKAGDPGGAQAWKTRLEERQRAERGLRRDGREAVGLGPAE
jgi:hypothetical protein